MTPLPIRETGPNEDANVKVVALRPKVEEKRARKARTKARQAEELRRLLRLALGLPML